ncbi:hypothetical protein KI387_038097, partial [Taxus chinensis]
LEALLNQTQLYSEFLLEQMEDANFGSSENGDAKDPEPKANTDGRGRKRRGNGCNKNGHSKERKLENCRRGRRRKVTTSNAQVQLTRMCAEPVVSKLTLTTRMNAKDVLAIFNTGTIFNEISSRQIPLKEENSVVPGMCSCVKEVGVRKHVYKGIRKRPWGKWVGETRDLAKGVSVWLSTSSTSEEAVRAYDAAARKIRGKKAKVNFVEEKPASCSSKELQ